MGKQMSYQAYFNEVQAVVQVLDEWVREVGPDDLATTWQPERFTALWQAVELLSRAHAVLLPLVELDLSKAALVLPDAREKAQQQPKAARLYDAQGRPLA